MAWCTGTGRRNKMSDQKQGLSANISFDAEGFFKDEAVKGAILRHTKVEMVKTAPPVTGRPFMRGVNEPGEGQTVWTPCQSTGRPLRMAWSGEGNYIDGILQRQLKMGELYPTEADCIEGEKRREIVARYRGMGMEFKPNTPNWYALAIFNVDGTCVSVDIRSGFCKVSCAIYFKSKANCQTAVDTINREYGDGAFLRYVLGVR
jgi:hypothetical protein